ncbi:MAG: hypothetical protein MI674_00760 [Cytophagales bacterium]|nr:hypothetical protein [Cytophagales bacterium]
MILGKVILLNLCCCHLQRTKKAMSVVGIPEKDQTLTFRVAAAVLHMGNISFIEGEESDSSILASEDSEMHLAAAAELLGITPEGLKHALTTRTRITRDGEVVSWCSKGHWQIIYSV